VRFDGDRLDVHRQDACCDCAHTDGERLDDDLCPVLDAMLGSGVGPGMEIRVLACPHQQPAPEVRPPEVSVPAGRAMVSTTIYVDPAAMAALIALSARTKVPRAAYIREAVDLILEREEGACA